MSAVGFFQNIMRAYSAQQQTEQAISAMVEYVKPEVKEWVVMMVLQRLRENFTPAEVDKIHSSPVMAEAGDLWAHLAGIGFLCGMAECTGEQLPSTHMSRLISDAETARDHIAANASHTFASWGKIKVNYIQQCLCQLGSHVALDHGRHRGNRAAQEPIILKNPYPNKR